MTKIQSSDEISRHKYVLKTDIPTMSMYNWIADIIYLNNIIFRSYVYMALEKAIMYGMGIGFFLLF